MPPRSVNPVVLEAEAAEFFGELQSWEDEVDAAERSRWRNRYGRVRPPSLGDRFIWPGEPPEGPRWYLQVHCFGGKPGFDLAQPATGRRKFFPLWLWRTRMEWDHYGTLWRPRPSAASGG